MPQCLGRKGAGGPGRRDEHRPMMHPCGKASHWHLGLREEQHCEQAQRGHPSTGTAETPLERWLQLRALQHRKDTASAEGASGGTLRDCSTSPTGRISPKVPCLLTEQGLSSLEKRRCRGILPMHINSWREGMQERQTPTPQQCSVAGQGAIN